MAAVKPQAKYVITTVFESKSKYHNELTRKQSKNMKTYSNGWQTCVTKS